MANARQFAIDIDREFAETEADVRTVVRKLALTALAKVVRRTPVGDPTFWKSDPPEGYVGGRARNNWFVQIGGPGSKTTEIVDASGAGANARGAAAVAAYRSLKNWPTISIYNNLPYIGRLEDGYSHQAPPGGIVEITVAELRLERAV